MLSRRRAEGADSEFTGAMLQSVMVLAVALIAVTVFEAYSEDKGRDGKGHRTKPIRIRHELATTLSPATVFQ